MIRIANDGPGGPPPRSGPGPDRCGHLAWGGYAGVSGRVLKHNKLIEIRRSLAEAQEQLTASPPNIASALQTVNRLRGLGQLSFASKHPVMAGREASVRLALESPDEVRQSRTDPGMLLFYKAEEARRWVCA